MHDTALQIGKLFFDIYSPQDKTVSIVEFGSMDINGSIKDFKPNDSRYVGLDIATGPGVDVVIGDVDLLPLSDGSADIVVSTSQMEHDPAFWQTFDAFVRLVKPGGLIYINSPSNGKVHRYPSDFWRFYPDAGIALARWASRDGIDEVRVVESFISDRGADGWNDFVAVFVKNPPEEFGPDDYIYRHVSCSNVRLYMSSEIYYSCSETEDMKLLQLAQEDADSSESQIRFLQQQLQALQNRVDKEIASVSAYEGKLRVASEENSALRTSFGMLEGENQNFKNKIFDLSTKNSMLESELLGYLSVLKARGLETDVLKKDLQLVQCDLSKLERDLEQSQSQLGEIHSRNLRGAQELLKMKTQYWCLVNTIISKHLEGSLVSSPINEEPIGRSTSTHESIRKEYCGYFDPVWYLRTNIDVLVAGLDPLDHYMNFGWKEGRDPAPWFSLAEHMPARVHQASDAVDPFLCYLVDQREKQISSANALTHSEDLREA